MIVQSNHKDPDYLNQRIELFLQQFEQELLDVTNANYITDDSLANYLQATIQSLLEKPKNLSEESKQYLEELRLNTYLFDRKLRLANYLSSTSSSAEEASPKDWRAIVKEFFQHYVLNEASRRKFSSYFYGSKQKFSPLTSYSSNVELIKNPSVFKREHAMLPSVSFDYVYQPFVAASSSTEGEEEK